RLFEQTRVLGDGPLTPAGVDEHVQVAEQSVDVIWTDAFWHDTFDDQQAGAAVTGGVPASLQDCHRLFVLPVVKDRFHQIGVRAGWHVLEEAAADKVAAIDQARVLKTPPRALHHVGPVEQDATYGWMAFEDRHEHRAVAAADVGDLAEW